MVSSTISWPRLWQTQSYLADVVIELEALLDVRKIRNWTAKQDVQNAMMNDIDDYLYRVKEHSELAITRTQMDSIIENIIDVARKRDRLFD
jgi:hypothetical protein